MTSNESQACETAVVATEEEVSKIVRNHILAAMGVGLIPLPVFDMVGLTGVQLNMLRRLAKAYNIPFSEDKGKNVIASLIGGVASIPLSGSIASFIKTVPLIGQVIGLLTMPVVAGAVTYAVGKVFIQHFASGGTFLTFDPEAVREYYAEMLEQGERVAAGMK